MPARLVTTAVVLALAASLRGSPADPVAADAETHRLRGVAAIRRADYTAARQELTAARDDFVRARDGRGIALADLSLARQAELSTDWPRLRQLAAAARDGFRMLGDRADEVRALRQLARDSTLDADAQLAMLDNAVELARHIDDPTLLGEVLADRGDEYFNRANYAAAMADYQPAVAAFERGGDGNQLARALVSLGRVYRAHGEPAQARPLYERALALEQQVGDRQGAIQALNAIAVTDDYLGRHDAAMREYERALARARETGSARLISFQLGNLGGGYLRGHDYRHAIPILEAVVKDVDPYLAATRRSQLALAYRKSGRAADALPLDELALAGDRAQHRDDEVVQDLEERAKTLGALGRSGAALADVREALDLLDRVRARLVPSDVMKQGFTALYKDVYGEAIDLLERRGDARAALDISERARSRALLDLLASRDLRVDAAPAPAGEIQAAARRLGSTIVSYFVTSDAAFAWVVTPDRVRLHRLDADAATLTTLVAATRPAHAGREPWLASGAPAPWRELARRLIDPLRTELPARKGALVTIVPYGPLFALSFGGLLEADGRYLLEDYTIHYAPSVAVLRFTRAAEPSGVPRYLFVADPAATGVAPLPGARAEVQALTTVLRSGRTTVLAGAAADVAAVTARMPAASIIHLAAHAVASEADPLESYLALAGGRLRLADVYRLRLHADLVTLSACRTALGPLAGDGVAGLTRAFIYAGAASVIATTWDVADAPTTTLMRGMYEARAHGRGKAAALREAQLRLLADLRAGRVRVAEPDGPITLPPDPYFWAGFVLVGEP
jgi:CHAT domain-containing protein/Tfp pilus assembly protein PilF